MKRSKKLNLDATVVWLYLWETVKQCDKGYDRDPDFMRLLTNMIKHYGDEFEAVYVLTDVTKLFGKGINQ